MFFISSVHYSLYFVLLFFIVFFSFLFRLFFSFFILLLMSSLDLVKKRKDKALGLYLFYFICKNKVYSFRAIYFNSFSRLSHEFYQVD